MSHFTYILFEHQYPYADFDEFVRKWVNEKNIWRYIHFRPQKSYLLDKRNKINLDFIAFLENIAEDFEYIKNNLDSEIKTELPTLNANKRRDYKEYYTEDTKSIVAKVYQEDIDLLGYNFDNSSLEKQLSDRVKNNGRMNIHC